MSRRRRRTGAHPGRVVSRRDARRAVRWAVLGAAAATMAAVAGAVVVWQDEPDSRIVAGHHTEHRVPTVRRRCRPRRWPPKRRPRRRSHRRPRRRRAPPSAAERARRELPRPATRAEARPVRRRRRPGGHVRRCRRRERRMDRRRPRRAGRRDRGARRGDPQGAAGRPSRSSPSAGPTTCSTGSSATKPSRAGLLGRRDPAHRRARRPGRRLRTPIDAARVHSSCPPGRSGWARPAIVDRNRLPRHRAHAVRGRRRRAARAGPTPRPSSRSTSSTGPLGGRNVVAADRSSATRSTRPRTAASRPPSPAAGGGAVYWTAIGPPDGRDGRFGLPGRHDPGHRGHGGRRVGAVVPDPRRLVGRRRRRRWHDPGPRRGRPGRAGQARRGARGTGGDDHDPSATGLPDRTAGRGDRRGQADHPRRGRRDGLRPGQLVGRGHAARRLRADRRRLPVVVGAGRDRRLGRRPPRRNRGLRGRREPPRHPARSRRRLRGLRRARSGTGRRSGGARPERRRRLRDRRGAADRPDLVAARGWRPVRRAHRGAHVHRVVRRRGQRRHRQRGRDVDQRRRLRRLPHVRRAGRTGRLPRHGRQRQPARQPGRAGPGHHERRAAVDGAARRHGQRTDWYGDRILVNVPSQDDLSTPVSVVVLDAATGAVVTTVPTDLDVAFVS